MADGETPLTALRQRVLDFRDERDWKQFHNPKDLALALSIEASELLEHFRFKSNEEIAGELPALRPELADEMADVLYFLLLLSDETGIDLSQALAAKMAKSAARYPVERARGRNVKYDKL